MVVLPGFLSFLACMAFVGTRPADVPRSAAAVVSGAGAVALASTVLWAIPMHDRLDEIGRSAETIDNLLRANVLRTMALTGATLTLGWSAWRSGRSH